MGINDLIKYGFVEAGKWELNEKSRKKCGVKADLDNHKLAGERVVYAFVVGDEVKYIGICREQETTLEERMGTQRYNKCMPCLIKEQIDKKNDPVKIFALKPDKKEYKGIEVDLVTGLEPDLINKFKSPNTKSEMPEWNDRTANYNKKKKSKPKE